MDVETFLREFAEILEIPSSEITQATELASLKNWDSMTVLSFMALVDEKFGGEVNPDDIETAQTVGDLYRLASAQASSAAS